MPSPPMNTSNHSELLLDEVPTDKTMAEEHKNFGNALVITIMFRSQTCFLYLN